MSQETAERLLTTNAIDIRLHVNGIWQGTHRMFYHGSIPQSLMRTMAVMESYELLVDVIEVAETETHEVIQTLAFDGADPRFSKRVGVRCADWRSQTTDACVLNHSIERG